MHDHHPTILSAADYARLQGLMCTMIGSRTPLASVLRRKLGSAVIMLPSDAGPDLVTSGRTVRFRINDGEQDERKLVWEADEHDDASALSLLETRGLALLGLSIGQTISYVVESGSTETLTVEHVFDNEDDETLVTPAVAAAALGSRNLPL